MKLFFYLYEQHFYQVKPELLSLTLSSWAFFLDFQINSKNATRTAIASPPRSTTNIPPTLLTSSAFAFDSVALRSDMHLPVPFHHLLYNSWTFPSSCRWSIASDSLSLSGDPTHKIRIFIILVWISPFTQAFIKAIYSLRILMSRYDVFFHLKVHIVNILNSVSFTN